MLPPNPACKKATWGTLLTLLECKDEVLLSRPARLGNSYSLPTLLAQFKEWPEIYAAAVALHLSTPGQGALETVQAITQLLCARCSASEMRQLPLSDIAALLNNEAINATVAAADAGVADSAMLQSAARAGKTKSDDNDNDRKDSGHPSRPTQVTASAGSPSVRPELSKWALGFEYQGAWHVFKRFGEVWRLQARAKGIKSGRQEQLLELFAEDGGYLSDNEAVKSVRPVHSQEDKRAIMKCVKSDISRLRKVLRMNINVADDKINPLPRDRHTQGWQAGIAIGYAVQNDKGDLEFRLREQLTAEENLDALRIGR